MKRPEYVPEWKEGMAPLLVGIHKNAVDKMTDMTACKDCQRDFMLFYIHTVAAGMSAYGLTFGDVFATLKEMERLRQEGEGPWAKGR